MAIEIVDLPSYNMVDLSIVLLVYQRVIIYIYMVLGYHYFRKPPNVEKKRGAKGGGTNGRF